MLANQQIVDDFKKILTIVISETNGIGLNDTLELLSFDKKIKENPLYEKMLMEFRRLLAGFHEDEVDIHTLLSHPVSLAFFEFFKSFPLKYYEEHIHLTGSLSAEFILPRIKKLLKGPHKKIYEQKITEVYGKDALPIESIEDVDKLIRLQEGEQFLTYLRILYLPKLILNSKKAHAEAAYHMASELYHKYNIGHIRLKFSISRETSKSSEQIPGLEKLTEEDVVFGLYDGYQKFKKEHPDFNFILSPSFRKEGKFYNKELFPSKKEHFNSQVEKLLNLMEKNPELKKHLVEVDTVGDEKELYRKKHFEEMKDGLRKLQYNGLKIRSHHGETWKTLKRGVQSVDNAMNIWHIDTLEHGLSLGINPNYYFHRLFQRVIKKNRKGEKIARKDHEFAELSDMSWRHPEILEKLVNGDRLSDNEETLFIKAKFYTAREIEHYQHDVLNRMIDKKVSLVALPTSNMRLTNSFPDYKDHPFSWWEKKGVALGVGTDNYITLSTDYIQEMLILLYSDLENFKLTKLLMVTTKEKRRPYISHLLWKMRKELK
jgi:adenosine deaminase